MWLENYNHRSVLERISDWFSWSSKECKELKYTIEKAVEVREKLLPEIEKHILECASPEEELRNKTVVIQSLDSEDGCIELPLIEIYDAASDALLALEADYKMLTHSAPEDCLAEMYERKKALESLAERCIVSVHKNNTTDLVILDYGKSLCEGVTQGVINSVHDMVDHPVETAAYALAGRCMFMYQVGKIGYNLAKIGITSAQNSDEGVKQWKEYIKPATDFAQALQDASGVERLKILTSFVSGLIVQHKILEKINQTCNAAKDKVISVVENTSLKPQLINGYSTHEDVLFNKHSISSQNSTNNKLIDVVNISCEEINQANIAILKNGYYEVNGFRFSKYYYERLWKEGRQAPSIVAKEVLDSALCVLPDHKEGFFRYEGAGWELIYNPISKEVWHIQPIKNKK